jgi:PAS domain S-box-containing protein
MKKYEGRIFQQAIEAAANAIVVVSQKGKIVLVNSRTEKIFGYRRKELLGQPVEILVPQPLRDHHVRFREDFHSHPKARAMGAGRDVYGRRKDGTQFPVEIGLKPIEADEGTWIISSIVDISERKQTEEALRESEQRFRSIADSAPVLIWTSGQDKQCNYFNKTWLDFTGRSMEAELGSGWTKGVHATDLKTCMDIYSQSFDRREKFGMEYRLRRHDGEYRWIFDVGVPRFNPDHSFVGYIGSCVDVTERKRAEETVRESEERLRLAARVGKMFAYEWDIATDVVVRSDEASNILGLAGESMTVTHRQVVASLHPGDQAKLIRSIAALTPESPNIQISSRFLRLDGSEIWLERTGHAFFDEHGRMVRMIGMVADITERKLTEEALSKVSGRLIEAHEEERIRIARELHDDIGQRLALLTIELEQLKENSSDFPGRVRRSLDQIWKQASEIATDTQSLSHELHSSKLEYVGLESAMRGFCNEFAKQHMVEVKFTARTIPSSLSHEISLCLFRVMQEALHNAMKHSGVQHFEVKAEGSTKEIHLTIRDAGMGFDPELARNNQGLGLISMTERVNLVGGTLSITSKPGTGTEITIHVPVGTDTKAMSSSA